MLALNLDTQGTKTSLIPCPSPHLVNFSYPLFVALEQGKPTFAASATEFIWYIKIVKSG